MANAIAASVRAISPNLAILVISGTELEHAARAAGVVVYSEIFADRGYLPNSRLVPRAKPEAMTDDPDAAIIRLLGFLVSGLMPVVGGDPIPLAAHSICVHGDGPGAVEMAGQIRARLGAAGVTIAAFLSA